MEVIIFSAEWPPETDPLMDDAAQINRIFKAAETGAPVIIDGKCYRLTAFDGSEPGRFVAWGALA